MTSHNDLDRQLNDFLRDGPDELPYGSLDAVRDRTEQTRQRVVLGPWRIPEMNKFLTIGLGAAAVVLALFVGVQLFSTPDGGTGGQPTSTATLEPTSELSVDDCELASLQRREVTDRGAEPPLVFRRVVDRGVGAERLGEVRA